MKKIERLSSHQDDRGIIVDLIENESINAITLVTFKEGAVRGNHYHKATTQWNYIISGKIRFLSQVPGQEKQELILEKGDLAASLPNESHTLVGLENSEVLIITKGPRGGQEYESDTFRLKIPLA